MEKNLDIIVQGGLWPFTNQTLYYYKSLPFVNNVILSTWEDEQYLDTIDWTGPIVLSKKPKKNGVGNMNLQILSTHAGLKESKAKYAMKTRTDWKVYDHYIDREFNDFLQRSANLPKIQFLDREGYARPIFAGALAHNLPYHPNDVLMLGRTQDLQEFWNLSFTEEECDHSNEWGNHHQQADKGLDFTKTVRNPVWFGLNYAAKFSKVAKKHLENFSEYVLDNAPKYDEAMKEYEKIRNFLWQPMRKPDIWWVKTPDNKYPDHWTFDYDYYYNNEYIFREFKTIQY
tara:strand:- start:1554 stop:2411 length:858 start_codon:yes stop_codon:yes gene_type:complete